MRNTPPLAVHTAIQEVAAYLGKVGIGKDRENKHQNYKFRGIDDVLNAMSSALVSARMAILPVSIERSLDHVTVEKNGKPQTTYIADLQVTYRLISLVDGSDIHVTMCGMGFDNSDKAVTKALSQAYKYLCIQTFSIPVEGLPDSEDDHLQPQDADHEPVVPVDQEPADLSEQLADYISRINESEDGETLQKAFAAGWKFFRIRKAETEKLKLKEVYETRKAQLDGAA